MSRFAQLISAAVAAVAVAVFWWSAGVPKPMPEGTRLEGTRIPCASYAPFRRGQSPFDPTLVIPEAQIDEDLARLKQVTDCVRTYSIEKGLDKVPALARKHGMSVLQGIWLGRDVTRNAQEIEQAVELIKANADTIKLVVVGNEVLLRGEMSAADLKATIAGVRSRVPVPVTYADVWEFWVRNADLASVVDTVTVHILPYWEDYPVPAERAAEHVISIRSEVVKHFPGKTILIGETGWPSEGRQRDGAVPSPWNQARAVQDIVVAAKARGYELNLIEAFDQPWKRAQEGTVGGHWGFLDADSREPKFKVGEPVSNYPFWPWQAAGGVLLALAVVAAGSFGRGIPAELPMVRIAFVGVLAAAAGAAIGHAVEDLMLDSRDLAEAARSAVVAAVAILAPLVAARAIALGIGPASFAQVLRTDRRPVDRTSLALAAATMAAAVMATIFALGLVFDPRYREFPISSFVGPVLGLALVRLVTPRRAAGPDASELMFAAMFVIAGLVIPIKETLENTQALAFGALLVILGLGLRGLSAARS